LVAAWWLSFGLPLPLGEEEHGENHERGREYDVGLAFTCVRTLVTWRC
jgi:hypothetical protein